MFAAAATKIAALTAIATLAVAAPAVASLKPHHGPAPTFGSAANYVTSIDRDVESGTMKQVACAPGAQPGARCYVAR